MPQLGPKLTSIDLKPGVGLMFSCPGCLLIHQVRVAGDGTQPIWTYNGQAEAPTFRPSILATWNWGGNGSPEARRCHSFVTGGWIDFLADSTHPLAGRRVRLPDLPGWLCDSPT